MSVSIGFAIQRLTNINIKCTQPNKVIVGGRVDTVCFQKTGIITKKQINLIGYVLNENKRLTNILVNSKNLENNNGIKSF